MIYIGYEIIRDSASNDLYDSDGELLIGSSSEWIVQEVFEVESFTLTPNLAVINASVKAVVRVLEGVKETRLPVWYSGDVYSGEV